MEYEFHTKPFKHQLKALKLALKKGSLAFLMEPGCAKTKPAIDFIGCLHIRDNHNRVLVLMPKSVIGVWEDEIELHLPPSIKRRVVRLEGSGRAKKIAQYMEPDILTIFLISYDSAWRSKKQLIKWKPQIAICDESHYISGATSKRTKGVLAIGKVAKNHLILTGTFLPNGPFHAYPQMNFLNPECFPMSWTKFKERYGIWVRLESFTKLKRYKRLHEIKAIIKEHSIIVRKDEALDLPKKTDVIVPVEMTPKAWKYYKQIRDQKIIEFGKKSATAEIILTELIRFQQITSGFIKVETGEYDHRNNPITEEVDIHNEKLKALLESINVYLLNGESIIVFVRFTWEVNKTMAMLRKNKIKAYELTGKTKSTDRDKIRRDFQDKKFPVLVAQIAVGGIGITLTAASVAMFLSNTTRLEHYIQAKDRIHRPGQTKPVTYVHFIVKGTIDEKLMQAHKEKKKLSDSLTPSNWSKYI